MPQLYSVTSSLTNVLARVTKWYRQCEAASRISPKVAWYQEMIIHNEDIKELIAEVPEGHKHLRTTIVFQDGTEFVFQEATIANLVRAYITVKTHPTIRKAVLKGKELTDRKDGYAEWQLVEEK